MEIENQFKVLREGMRLDFCCYDYQPEKHKWRHPANTCLPDIMQEHIDKCLEKVKSEVKEVLIGSILSMSKYKEGEIKEALQEYQDIIFKELKLE